MFSYLLSALVGLIAGWFFLPRPAWAETAMALVIAKVPALAPFLKKN